MKKSRTVHPAAGVESQPPRRLLLVELPIDTEADLFELAVRSRLQVLDAMLDDDSGTLPPVPDHRTFGHSGRSRHAEVPVHRDSEAACCAGEWLGLTCVSQLVLTIVAVEAAARSSNNVAIC